MFIQKKNSPQQNKQYPDVVYADAIALLAKAISGARNYDALFVKSSSNQTMHNASVFQDIYSVKTAAITYALAKLLETCSLKHTHVDIERFVRKLEALQQDIRARNDRAFLRNVDDMFVMIEKEERKFPQYVQAVQSRALLNKSMKLVDHGISVGQAANLAGISQWQLYSYLGKSSIQDNGSDSVTNMKKRLRLALEIFGGDKNG